MKGTNRNITIGFECLAGFYPVAIKLNNTYNAVTRYQLIIVIQKTQGLPDTNEKVKYRLSWIFNGSIPEISSSRSEETNLAKIKSVTNKGLVTVELSQQILLPYPQANQTYNNTARKLKVESAESAKFLDSLVLQFSLVT